VEVRGPFPTDHEGIEGTNRTRTKPYDGIYVDRKLHAKGIPVPLGGGKQGLVFDSRIHPDLERVVPVLPTDSEAPQMQHMAVVRDFNR
jgi:hypothetical protein